MSEHHILFSGEVTPQSASNFTATLIQLAGHAASKVVIALNSGGGNVVSGIAMYNAMLAMPYEIITHNIGNCDSIANVIFLGGTKRYACAASTFMFHGVGFNGTANIRYEENNLREMLDTILADHARISGILNTRTNGGISVKAGMKLFKEQKTRTAQWALDKGLITGIGDFAFPVGGNVHLLIN